jgi:hypothetical protein
MPHSSWPGSWKTASRPHRRPAATQRGTTRLRLEQLEDRTLPSFGFGWAFHVGGTTSGLEVGRGIATDGQGNVYVSGEFYGTNVNFDPLNPSPAPSAYLSGWSTAFAAKYSSNGFLQWATPLQALNGSFQSSDIAVQGPNVYVTAGNGVNAIAVAKLDATSGTVVWTVSLPVGTTSSPTMRVAVGPSTGNVYVTSSTASSQAYVAKLDATGAIKWTQTTSGGSAAGNGVAVYDDPSTGSESVYVTGNYTGTTTFGTVTQTSLSGSQDIFVWKLNADDGTTAGATSVGTTNNDISSGIAVDGAGFAYLTGGEGTGKPYTFQSLVAKLTPTLATSWTKFFSGKGGSSGYGHAVALDAAGHVYTTGWFQGTFDFDPGPGTSTIQSGGGGRGIDAYVSELDSLGNFVTAADFHGTSTDPYGADGGWGITVDRASPGSPNVYTTGEFHGTWDFDPTAGTNLLTSNGDRDIFVSKLTQPASPLRATPGSSSLAVAPSADQALALLSVSGNIIDAVSFVADGGSRGQAASLPVAQDVSGISLQGANPPTTLPPALLHSPSAPAVDQLIVDLVSSGRADALAADARLAPSA